MQQRDGAWSRRHSILIHRWRGHVMRRPRGHWVRRVLEVQTGAWLAARRVHHGGGALVWRIGTRLPGRVPVDGKTVSRLLEPLMRTWGEAFWRAAFRCVPARLVSPARTHICARASDRAACSACLGRRRWRRRRVHRSEERGSSIPILPLCVLGGFQPSRRGARSWQRVWAATAKPQGVADQGPGGSA